MHLLLLFFRGDIVHGTRKKWTNDGGDLNLDVLPWFFKKYFKTLKEITVSHNYSNNKIIFFTDLDEISEDIVHDKLIKRTDFGGDLNSDLFTFQGRAVFFIFANKVLNRIWWNTSGNVGHGRKVQEYVNLCLFLLFHVKVFYYF